MPFIANSFDFFYLFNQLPINFLRKGSKINTIVGTNIPVMIKVLRGKGKFLI